MNWDVWMSDNFLVNFCYVLMLIKFIDTLLLQVSCQYTQRCVFQFLFQGIHYCHSSKSTGKETVKTHLCAVQWKLRDFLKGSTLLYPGCLAGGTVQIWVWAPSEKVASLRTCKVFDLLVIIIFTKRSSVPKGMSAHLGIFYYRLFFLRSIAHFFTQIYMNCFVSS